VKYNDIKADILKFRKERNPLATALKTLKSDIDREHFVKLKAAERAGTEYIPDDASVIKKVKKHIEGLQELIQETHTEAGYQELSGEVTQLETYLPQEISLEELKDLVREVSPETKGNIGKTFGAIKKLAAERGLAYDASKVKGLIAEVNNEVPQV